MWEGTDAVLTCLKGAQAASSNKSFLKIPLFPNVKVNSTKQ